MDRIAFTIGNIIIYKYAVCIVCGIILAIILGAILFKRAGIEPDFILVIFLYAVPTAIIFARLGYVLPRLGNEFKTFADIVAIRGGGLTITTGIVGGALAVILACLIHKKSIFRIGDLLAAPLLVGQAIGRLGNYFNQELYGKVIETKIFEPIGIKIGSSPELHHPLFAYEGILNALMALVIIFLIFKFLPRVNYKDKNAVYAHLGDLLSSKYEDKLKPGTIVFLYFTWYPLIRGLLEALKDRTNPPFAINGVMVIQAISLIVAPLMLLCLTLVSLGYLKLESSHMKIRHFKLIDNLQTKNNESIYV